MPERRFFVAPEDIHPDGVAVVRGTEHHHLTRVLRLKAGDEVFVFDGDGHGFAGVVDGLLRQEALIRLTAPDRRAVEPGLRLTLVQGIPHHDKMDLIVQKVTEVGVTEIVPIMARRTAVKVDRTDGSKRLERWRRIAREAARQSGRLRVPVIRGPLAWEELLDAGADAPAPKRFILCPGTDGPPGIGPLDLPAGAVSAMLAVGPEGGWSPDEVARAAGGGFSPVGLGPRVLRTETAGIVAAALLLFLAGDLGGGPAGLRRG